MPESHSPQEVQDLLDQGLVALVDGKVQEAIVTWMKVLEIDANEPRAVDYLETLEVIEPRSETADPDEDSGGIGVEVPETGEWSAPFESQSELDVAPPPDGEGAEFSGGPMSDEDRNGLLEQVYSEREAGNLGAALDICEEILKRAPGDFETTTVATEVKEELVSFYLDGLKPLDQIPELAADDSNILELSLDPIGGFLLSQIDGRITVEELLTIMGTFDQYRVVSALHLFINQEILRLKPPE
jgi:hypothetical protein